MRACSAAASRFALATTACSKTDAATVQALLREVFERYGLPARINSDNGSVAGVANGTGSLGTVGIGGNEAMGRILAGGERDMADWVNKLYGQAFAAVYVQPGARVAVHLEQPLHIDRDAQGRRVNHRIGEAHASDLD